MKKTVLVTGASAGIGRATAIYLAQNGYLVYGAARRMDKMQDLKPYGIRPIALDLANDESITVCVGEIFNEVGSIDILVNNAGFGCEGAIEDVTMEKARYQMEVNVFGAMRLSQLALPEMRKKNYGKIINISSVGGKIALPLGGWYHASKFAIEALSDSMRMEVRPFGIDVIVIEPGGIKSEWGNIALESLVNVSGNSAYKEMVKGAEKGFRQTEKNNSEPIVIARLIKKVIEAVRPSTRYAGGSMAKPMLFLRSILPDRILDRLILSQTK
ncbi:oxidoreductase [Pedobacter gandavensis]|uniref:oxidoreductase n=1 Tax=Pedobacter gandavensis TaxID=2679963 RepID=UPI0029305695|nr:oxidoreductase [Pedobacter gandavensis]